MSNPTDPRSGLIRIPPAEAASEAIERLVSKRQLQVERGDVVVLREPVPRLKQSSSPLWRYRLFVHPAADSDGRVFNSFQHAASEAEQLAAQRRARLLYVENGVPSLVNDHRR